MKVLTVIGARPQFIKAAPLSRALRGRSREVMVHTGQHYDDMMSEVFFRELDLPAPDRNLGVGSSSHSTQTGQMMIELEKVMLAEKPDWVIVYGDTNSTLAGSLVAAKLNVRLAHIEAGLRSFDRTMPEEINRVVTDHLSSLNFCPTATSVTNLTKEGVIDGVHLVGDVMYDIFLKHLHVAQRRRPAVLEQPVFKKEFALATIHRADNTDNREHLSAIIEGLATAGVPVLLPIHPRTRSAIKAHNLAIPDTLTVCEPVGYLDMLALEVGADVIVTDSGGVQKEAYFVGTPCVTVRQTTEWPETVDAGWNTLVGVDSSLIAQSIRTFRPSGQRPSCFGDGHAAEKIVTILGEASSQLA